MKAIRRFFSTLVLCTLLCAFCMWRGGTLPDLSGVTEKLRNAVAGEGSPLSDLLDKVGSSDLIPGQGDGDETYPGTETVDGVDAALEAALSTAISAKNEEVDIAEIGLTSAQVREQVERFFLTHPQFFYVSTGYTLSTHPETGRAMRITLNYLYEPEAIPAMEATYQAAVQSIMEKAPQSGSDFDKVLYVHDYLVQNFSYDYEGLRTEEATGQNVAVRDTYNFFTRKVGVCQAYTLAFIALCDELGIESLPVTCDPLNHVWNLVELDGAWYHIDVTWDDAGGESAAVFPSYISYDYFLLSGEQLYLNGRTEVWEATKTAESKLYDTAIWHNSTTPMVSTGTAYYCTVYESVQGSAKIALYGGTPTEMERKLTLDANWNYAQAWASLVVYEGDLIMNTANTFYRYDVESGTATVLQVMTGTLNGKRIFGICGISSTGLISYVVASEYHGSYETYGWSVPG